MSWHLTKAIGSIVKHGGESRVRECPIGGAWSFPGLQLLSGGCTLEGITPVCTPRCTVVLHNYTYVYTCIDTSPVTR